MTQTAQDLMNALVFNLNFGQDIVCALPEWCKPLMVNSWIDRRNMNSVEEIQNKIDLSNMRWYRMGSE